MPYPCATLTVEQGGGSDVNLNNLIEDSSGKNDTIFIVVVAFFMVRSSREGIRFTHRLSGYVSDGEVETREVQSPSSLSS